MPIGVYPRTEKYRKSRSEALKKNPLRYWLGKKRFIDDKWRKNLSDAAKRAGNRPKPRYGKDNSEWKGDHVGYGALHSWVKRHKGKAKKCSFCGKANGKIDWANIDGRYKRRLEDWFELCSRCHNQYDNVYEKMWKTRRLKANLKEKHGK